MGMGQGFVLANRDQRPADAGLEKRPGGADRDQGPAQDHEIETVVAVERDRAESGQGELQRRQAGNSHGAPGHRSPVEGDLLQDQGENQTGDGEGVPRHPERREPDDQARRRGDEAAAKDGEPRRNAERRGQDPHRVGAQAPERHLAKREESHVAVDQVEAGPRARQNAHALTRIDMW